ncbi:MAG: hypothetical protein ABIG96_01630 [Candidatus Micrarchaeota archaeon]
MSKGQGSIEFFLIAGFILLATSVLLNQADRQIQGTSALNNVLVSRSALDLEASALKYVYYSGNQTAITHRIFVPIGAQCFYVLSGEARMYCIVPGASKRVVGEYIDTPMPVVNNACYRSGWITVTTRNAGAGSIVMDCA